MARADSIGSDGGKETVPHSCDNVEVFTLRLTVLVASQTALAKIETMLRLQV